jgi:hypothetical protein
MKKSAKPVSQKATMKARQGKTWTEKMNDSSKAAVVKKTDKPFADIPAGGKMLIATPKIIDAYIRQIPKGKSVSLLTMRQDLALEFNAEYTCPVTTGIFLRIVSESAHEQWKAGKTIGRVTPFWRVVDPASALNKKLSFGETFVKTHRKKEGME